jgi:hypothetical protein
MNPWVWVAIGCLAAIVILTFAAGLCFYVGFVRNPEAKKMVSAMTQELEDLKTSQTNLGEIGEALKRYAQKHDGEFPTKLSELKNGYLKDPKVLINPSTGQEYSYTKPAKDAPGDTVVITAVHTIPGAPQILDLHKDGTVAQRQ